jgi:CO/xanthine dehydrogenase FAD-binding subunit
MNSEAPQYLRPSELQAALLSLAASPRLVLAGGTDLYASGTPMPQRLRQPVLDITAIDPLRAIRLEHAEILIGATATWAALCRAELPVWCQGLKQAGSQIGAQQIQNVATVAGNLCNASPAADGVPPLLALGARIDLASIRGQRTLGLEEFLLGPRRTACASDELVTGLRLAARSERARSVFYKLGARSYLVIAIVSLAVSVDFDMRGRVSYAGIAVGSCASRAQRLLALESRLLGMDRAGVQALAQTLVMAADAPEIAPIDDIRGTAAYRRDALATLLERSLREVCRG